ncbi:MAG TPA: hypothetical protein VFY34_05580, partial [Pyrinomonadaceae bacterium]|nr:hypothetical protein [Pyrinomonadaceae bacterium]
MNTRHVSRSTFERLTLTLFCFTVLLLIRPAEAANPPSGSISPGGPNVVWQGPLTGGASANETTCVEGTNCDTFKLTLTGTEE